MHAVSSVDGALRLLLVCLGLMVCELRAELPPVEEEGFVPIFNGANLHEWDGMPGAWEVRENAIWCTGKSENKNWLIWRGGEPEDFMLRLKFRYETGNSGVQVRSSDLGEWQVRGYQVEVAEQKAMGLWHHSLLKGDSEIEKVRKTLATAGQRVSIRRNGSRKIEQFAPADRIQSTCRPGGWNEMEIIVRGPRLVQKINGVVFSDLTDHEADYAQRRGVIALQDHGKGTIVAFKDIELKLLKPVPAMLDIEP